MKLFKHYNSLLAFVLAIAGLLSACSPPKGKFAGDNTNGETTSYSGNIIVSSSATRSIVMYDASFNESSIKILRQYPVSNTPNSISYYDQENIIVAVDGFPDRVEKINLRTADVNTGFILDSKNLAGTMRGIARLSGGDILVSDNTSGTHMERFSVASVNPIRYTVGWPMNLLNTTYRIFPLANNSFLACAGGSSDMARRYTEAGVVEATVSALSPGVSLGSAHDAISCVQDSMGRVAVAYSGSADAVRLYSSDMNTVVWTFQDPGALPSPLTLAVRSNGNFLVVDASNYILELSGADGTLVQLYSPQGISTATDILVMP